MGHAALVTFLIPTCFTLVCFLAAACNWEKDPTGYYSLDREQANALRLCYATILSLVAWLVWVTVLAYKYGGCMS